MTAIALDGSWTWSPEQRVTNRFEVLTCKVPQSLTSRNLLRPSLLSPDAANHTGVRAAIQLASYGIQEAGRIRGRAQWSADRVRTASLPCSERLQPLSVDAALERASPTPHIYILQQPCSQDAWRSESGWWPACKCLDLETRWMKQTTGHHADPSHRIAATPGDQDTLLITTPADVLAALQPGSLATWLDRDSMNSISMFAMSGTNGKHLRGTKRQW